MSKRKHADIAAEFNAAMKAAGVSRAWLARQIGRSGAGIHLWISGRFKPPAEILEWLWQRAENPPPKLPPHYRMPRRRGSPDTAA